VTAAISDVSPSRTTVCVTLQSDLKWTQHANNIIANAYKSLGFLKRNLKTSNTNIKSQAYLSLVRPKRCCNEGQVRVCSMSVTLLVLWYLLQAYLAARCWTISILLQCSTVWGFQTEHA
jgi:hypothetical protein